jgi:hypothetical protein
MRLDKKLLSFQFGGNGPQVLSAAHAIPIGKELISYGSDGGGQTITVVHKYPSLVLVERLPDSNCGWG